MYIVESARASSKSETVSHTITKLQFPDCRGVAEGGDLAGKSMCNLNFIHAFCAFANLKIGLRWEKSMCNLNFIHAFCAFANLKIGLRWDVVGDYAQLGKREQVTPKSGGNWAGTHVWLTVIIGRF